MSPRETYAARKERERRRDVIRELAFEMASRTALGDLNRVEKVKRDGYPCVQFAHPVTGHRCSCGAQMFPLPMFSAKSEMIPTWHCPFCSLAEIVQACELIARKTESSG